MLAHLFQFSQSFDNFLNERLKPNPKYTKASLQQEIVHKRNKAIFIMNFVFILMFISDIFINDGPILDNLLRISCALVTWLLLLISCCYHPQIFNLYYGLLCLVYGPMIIQAGHGGVANAFIAISILPLFVQVVTGSYYHYIFQALGQSLMLNTIYQKPMLEMIEYGSPTTVLGHLTYASNTLTMLQAVLVVLIDRFLSQAQTKAVKLEQRKNEAENQRVFLMSFSHEIRNLINSLTGNVKLASLENINVRTRDLLLNAEVCGELLLHLINNILDSGKAEIGELEINPVPTKTYETFERIWGICSELIRRKDLRGCMKIPKHLPRTLLIDHHRLTQIFLNLVGNSIKFTEKGSIDIALNWISDREMVDEKCFQPYPFNITDEHDEGLFEKQQSFTHLAPEYFMMATMGRGIDHSQLSRNSYNDCGILKIIVSDSGCGMTREQTERLFQKFMQVTTDTSKKKLGTGLGLFITKQLCQKMDGEIRVFSQKGRGSSFIFCIPAKVIEENNQALEDQDTMSEFLRGRDLKAMIVDDIPANHVILGNFFDNLGIKVMDIMMNGLDAYKKYRERVDSGDHIDIVSMDLDMPIMNGKDAARKIRELEAQRGIKPSFLIIVSGNCIESEITECLDKEGMIQADAFLRKPLTIDDLTRVIASHFVNSGGSLDWLEE